MFQFGRKGEGSGQFQCPTGVGVDPDGRIVVCERLGSRIQVTTRESLISAEIVNLQGKSFNLALCGFFYKLINYLKKKLSISSNASVLNSVF